MTAICTCRYTDSWRCARDQDLVGQIACHCVCHRRKRELTSERQKEIAIYREGAMDALALFAHWHDGVQYVGATGKTLIDAVEKIDSLLPAPVFDENGNPAHSKEIIRKLTESVGAGDRKLAELLFLRKELEKTRTLAATLYRERAGECWHWQGDEDDHLESLNCPVLIDADDLRRIVAERDALRVLHKSTLENDR